MSFEFGARVRVTPSDLYTETFPQLAETIRNLTGVVVASDEYETQVMFEKDYFEPSLDRDFEEGVFAGRVFFANNSDTIELV